MSDATIWVMESKTTGRDIWTIWSTHICFSESAARTWENTLNRPGRYTNEQFRARPYVPGPLSLSQSEKRP